MAEREILLVDALRTASDWRRTDHSTTNNGRRCVSYDGRQKIAAAAAAAAINGEDRVGAICRRHRAIISARPTERKPRILCAHATD